MKALIYNDFLETRGGGERSTISYGLALNLLGYDVTFATSRQFSISLNDLAATFGLDLPDNLKLREFNSEEELTRYCKEEQFDLFINHTYGSLLENPARLGILVIMFPYAESSSLLKNITSYTRVVAISHFTALYTELLWGLKNVDVLPPPIFKSLPASKSDASQEKENLILQIGRFNPGGHNKNQLEAIRFFRKLKESGKLDNSWKLLVAGNKNSGAETERYLQICKDELSDKAEIKLDLPFEELNIYLAKAKVLWQLTGINYPFGAEPRKCEHLGLVALDALQYGTIPLVYCRSGAAHLLPETFQFASLSELEALMLSVPQTAPADLLEELQFDSFVSELAKVIQGKSTKWENRYNKKLLARERAGFVKQNILGRNCCPLESENATLSDQKTTASTGSSVHKLLAPLYKIPVIGYLLKLIVVFFRGPAITEKTFCKFSEIEGTINFLREVAHKAEQSAKIAAERSSVIESHLPGILNHLSSMNSLLRDYRVRENEFTASLKELGISVSDIQQKDLLSAEELKNFSERIKQTADQLKLVVTQQDVFGGSIEEIWKRLEFVRKELLFEFHYGGKSKQSPANLAASKRDSAIGQPEIIHSEKLSGENLKLNLGCGHVPLDGYINVDQRDLPTVDLVATVDDLPVGTNSIEEIFSAHLLEHFPQEQLKRHLLPYWFSLLKAGGTFKAVIPDWETMSKQFASGEYAFSKFREVTFGGQDYEGDFHFNMFSKESLREILESAGFVEIEFPVVGRINGDCYEMEVSCSKPNLDFAADTSSLGESQLSVSVHDKLV